MRVAYLINQYPKVSHSFIRREIQALERQGVAVMRIAIRGWNETLVDSADLEERKITRYVLKVSTWKLLSSFLLVSSMHPINLLRAVATACCKSSKGDGPFFSRAVIESLESDRA